MGEVIPFPGPLAQARYLTKREAAAYLGVSPRTIERYQHAGLPTYRLPGRNVYRAAELDEWVQNLRA